MSKEKKLKVALIGTNGGKRTNLANDSGKQTAYLLRRERIQ